MPVHTSHTDNPLEQKPSLNLKKNQQNALKLINNAVQTRSPDSSQVSRSAVREAGSRQFVCPACGWVGGGGWGWVGVWVGVGGGRDGWGVGVGGGG